MSWSYHNMPGTDSPANRKDYVRLNVGDTDTNDQQITDEEINAALTTAVDDVFVASSLVARMLSAKYSRLSNLQMGEGALALEMDKIAARYDTLATNMEKQAKRVSSTSIGSPLAGGLTKSEIKDYETDPDWNEPRFKERQFNNPNRYLLDDHDEVH